MSGLGKLVVSLSANVAEFSSAMDKAAHQQRARMEQMQRNAEIAGRAIGLALVAGAGALAAAVSATASRADDMGKMAQSVGENVAEFSRLAHAAEMSGSSMDDLGGSLKRLNQNMFEAAETGKGPAAEAFDRLRISVRDAEGDMKSGSMIMSEIAQRFAAMEDGAVKTALANDLGGKSFANLIPLLNAGAEGLEAMKIEADELGIVISENTFRASEAFNDNLARMGKVQQGLVTQITADMLPTMVMLSDEFLAVAKNSGAIGVGVDVAKAVLQTLLVVGGNVAFVLNGVGREIGGISAQLGALASLDFDGFSAIGAAMREDAAAARAEFDAWEQRVMNPAPVDLDKLEAEANARTEIARRVAAEESKAQDAARAAALARVAGDKAAEKSALEAQRAAKKAAEEALRAQERLMDEGKRVFEATRTPVEQLATEFERLQHLLDAGAFGVRDSAEAWDTYTRAISAAQDRLIPTSDSVSALGDNIESLTARTESVEMVVSNAFAGMGDALADFVLTGKASFGDLITAMLRDLLRLEIQTQMTSVFKQSGGLAGIGAMLFGSASGAAGPAQGSMVSNTAQTYSIPIAGARALGGPVEAGKTYQVGENGRELITMASPGYVTPNSALSAPRVSVTINNTAQADVQQSSSTSADGTLNLEVMITERVKGRLIRETQQGGGLAPVLENKYGLNPAAGARR